MPLTPAKVRKRPPLVCLGKIKEYGAVAEPKEGKLFHYIPVEIDAQYSGMSTTFRLLFWPEMVEYDSEIEAPDPGLPKGQSAENDAKSSRYFVFANNIAHEDGTAHLQVLLGDKFDEFAAAVTESAKDGRIEPDTFRALIMKFLPVGTEVGYVLKQQTSKTEDGDKKLEDRYDLNRFWPVTRDGLKKIADSVKRSARGENPYQLTFQINS